MQYPIRVDASQLDTPRASRLKPTSIWLHDRSRLWESGRSDAVLGILESGISVAVKRLKCSETISETAFTEVRLPHTFHYLLTQSFIIRDSLLRSTSPSSFRTTGTFKVLLDLRTTSKARPIGLFLHGSLMGMCESFSQEESAESLGVYLWYE